MIALLADDVLRVVCIWVVAREPGIERSSENEQWSCRMFDAIGVRIVFHILIVVCLWFGFALWPYSKRLQNSDDVRMMMALSLGFVLMGFAFALLISRLEGVIAQVYKLALTVMLLVLFKHVFGNLARAMSLGKQIPLSVLWFKSGR
jgi:hypothetical protein